MEEKERKENEAWNSPNQQTRFQCVWIWRITHRTHSHTCSYLICATPPPMALRSPTHRGYTPRLHTRAEGLGAGRQGAGSGPTHTEATHTATHTGARGGYWWRYLKGKKSAPHWRRQSRKIKKSFSGANMTINIFRHFSFSLYLNEGWRSIE